MSTEEFTDPTLYLDDIEDAINDAATITDLRRQLEEMTQDRDSTQARLAEVQGYLTNARAAVTRTEEAHRKDIDTIGEVLLGEASDRDWCEDYDHVIDRLNTRLSVELPVRMRNWTVYMDVTLRVPVTVEARTVDDAENLACEKDFQAVIYNLARYQVDVTNSEIAETNLA